MTNWTKTLEGLSEPTALPQGDGQPAEAAEAADEVTIPIPRPKPFFHEAPVNADYKMGYADALAFLLPPSVGFTESYANGYTFGLLVRKEKEMYGGPTYPTSKYLFV